MYVEKLIKLRLKTFRGRSNQDFERPYGSINSLFDLNVANRQNTSRYLERPEYVGVLKALDTRKEDLFVDSGLITKGSYSRKPLTVSNVSAVFRYGKDIRDSGLASLENRSHGKVMGVFLDPK